MIKVENLEKKYGSKEALKGISFEINPGEIFALLGPNGAGKTTTIKILTGQLIADNGQAQVMNKNVFREEKKIRQVMGVVPEETNLYERLTIVENLKFFCRLYDTDFTKIFEYLDMVGLLSEKNVLVKNLSKGMKQKVLLIRALLHQPQVLFLDEPTSGLDPASANSIHQILQRLNQQGITILLTSHNMEEVDKLSNRVAFLNQGKIVALGTSQKLKLQYSSKQLKVVIKKEKEYQEKLLEIDSAESGRKIAGWIKNQQLVSIHSSEPSLADIFVKVTGRDLV